MQDHTGDQPDAAMTSQPRESLAALCRAMTIGALIGAAGAAVWRFAAGRVHDALQPAR